MQLHTHKHHVSVTGRVPAGVDEKTARAIEQAIAKAEQALYAGKLLSPGEAMAIAGPEARRKETLFSIACSVAWATDADQEHILAALEGHFPDLA